MTEQEINVAIAECLGWKNVHFYEDNAGPCVWSGIPPISEEEVFKMSEQKLHELRTYGTKLPNFYSSLDACALFEKQLSDQPDYQLCNRYNGNIAEILERAILAVDPDCIPDVDGFETTTATAPIRCEAYLRLKGKWVEREAK